MIQFPHRETVKHNYRRLDVAVDRDHRRNETPLDRWLVPKELSPTTTTPDSLTVRTRLYLLEGQVSQCTSHFYDISNSHYQYEESVVMAIRAAGAAA